MKRRDMLKMLGGGTAASLAVVTGREKAAAAWTAARVRFKPPRPPSAGDCRLSRLRT